VDPRTPVVVGAGQLSHRHEPGGEARDPVSLAAEAAGAAGEDSGTGGALLRRADSVRCVATTCWHYRDQAALLAGALGAAPRETVVTSQFGGDGPQLLIADTAASIAAGDVDVAVLAGAESIATLLDVQRRGERPPWPEQDEAVAPTRVIGTDRPPVNDAESAAGLLAPIYVYALLESAERARAGTGMDVVGELWSGFSAVAAANPHAWIRQEYSADDLVTPSAANRVVSTPYLKLLTANIQVDQAAALVMCSAEAAERAGVPRDRWVFPWAGAHAQEEWFVSARPELAASPAIRAIGRAVLEHAGVDIGDVAHVDLYSCFPVAVQVAARELGLALDDPARPLTVTGGLTFAGGPGNAYALHATAALVDRLRAEPEAVGLSTAVGWYLTKHAIGLFSATPPARPFRSLEPEVERPPARRPADGYRGPVTVEACTVPHGRDGSAEPAIVAALTPGGERVLTRTGDLRADDVGLTWEV
jgi:acetyl-CoA C-acetyltransferase